MRVDTVKTNGIVTSVALVRSDGEQVSSVTRFLRYVLDSGGSPNTAVAYGYDLRIVFEFFAEAEVDWREFRPAVGLELLGWLRRRPVRGPAQQLGRVAVGPTGRLMAPASVARILAAVSSFYDWAIIAELVEGENPMRRRRDLGLAMVAERHRPFTGNASRQVPVSREIRVRLPRRLPRPLSESDVSALLGSMTCLRDLSTVLLMLDGGLRPGEVLGLQLGDIGYGRRRVTIRKRDDHPRGVRANRGRSVLSICSSLGRWMQ
ncbi:tyrosine-type recombinase/integrase [Rhodococcus globerulus]|uniref:tyrosine-type recombinase/integrase n=1 Tax=Rhodococcus globerulus TaxID=33008 RepID=UPI001F353F8A|nr:site-specific integrase [Rhodococcus globerulus]